MSPIVVAKGYFYRYEQKRIVTGQATITILQRPKHGALADGGDGNYLYLPEKGYLGKDQATLLVDIGGVKVKVVYFFQAIDLNTIGEGLEETLCKKSIYWKISTALDPNGITNDLAGIVGQPSQMASSSINNTLISAAYQSPLTDALNSWY